MTSLASLRGKIVFLTCGFALLASLLIGSFAFYRTMQVTINTAISGLAGETRLMALRFRTAYEETKNDAFIVRHTPPIEGIIRTRGNRIDIKDGSTQQLWRSRLETIFTSVMESRPHYTQMRYIGVADGGRELVRVNRTESGLEAVPIEHLQQKANEPYFKEGIKLEEGQVYYSEVNYNREFGKVDQKRIPTIRTVVPVHYEGNIFGMMVINTNYTLLLEKTFQEVQPTKDTIVTNHAKDFAEYHYATQAMDFSFHDNYSKRPPAFINTIAGKTEDELSFVDPQEIAYFVRLNISPLNPNAFLGIITRTPKDVLLAGAHKTQRDTLMLTVLIIAFCLLIAAVVSRKLTKPLRKMTDEIVAAKPHTDKHLDLPTSLNDEIGDLARAFEQMTQTLQDNEGKLRTVLDNIVDGIITVDKSGLIDSFNPACEKIFGYSADEVLGKDVTIIMPNQYFKSQASHVGGGDKDQHIIGIGRELEGKRKDGEIFPMELSVSETQTTDTHLFTGIVRDITERKQMEVMKGEFISTVNHELRTPLTSIQGSLGLLNMVAKDSLDKKGQRLLALSYDNCQRLTHLVNDILDMEKIAAGKMDYTMERAEIGALVKEIVDQNQSYAEKYGVEFIVKIELTETYCKIDGSRFSQALANLLSNAAKFSPEGKAVIVTVASAEGDMVAISVADEGLGIPKSFHSKVFEKFAQADSSSTRAKDGTGLGLNITKSIIEAFGGDITFESVEGSGATFSIILPVLDRGEQPT